MALDDMDVYRNIVGLPGVKVIDNSFLSSYLVGEIENGVSNFKRLELESSLYDALEKFVDKRVTFPHGTLSEFKSLTQDICKKIRSLNGIINNSSKNSPEYNETCEIWKSMGFLLRRRESILEKILKKNPAENYISSNKWQTDILIAVTNVAEKCDVKQSYNKKHSLSLPQIKCSLNDIYTFAKALEISRRDHVFLTTRDDTVIEMYQNFYRNLDSLVEKYQFDFPDYSVCLVSKSENGNLSVIEPLEDPKPLDREEIKRFYKTFS